MLAILLAAGVAIHKTNAQLVIQGNDGSDGPLVITRNQVIDLGEAVTGTWDAGNIANAGKGVYDPEKWAVVFKYSSVTINEGVTVTFLNHPSRAPVVWLVKGNVTIQGKISLDGQPGAPGNSPTVPFGTAGGPGGFRGNAGASGAWGPGFGPPSARYWQHRSVYGNPESTPLIGGSGGYHGFGVSGGGGGGAILIAAEGRLSIPSSGSITALGGRNNDRDAAGGAIRLIADTLAGEGRLNAGPEGIIRLEANTSTQQRFNKTPDTQTYLPGSVPRLWPAADAPTVKIVRIAGLEVPADPLARIDDGSDIRIQTGVAVDVDIETRNFPEDGTVVLRVSPKLNQDGIREYTAERLQGNRALSTWRVNRALDTGFSVLQVRAFVPRR